MVNLVFPIVERQLWLDWAQDVYIYWELGAPDSGPPDPDLWNWWHNEQCVAVIATHPSAPKMDFEPTLAAVPWYTAGLVALVILDVMAWGYAFYLLPTSRRNTILKLLTWCWAFIPLGLLFVATYHATLINHVMQHAWWFDGATFSDQVEQSLLAGPHWVVPSWMIEYGTSYLMVGFLFLATLTIIAMPNDRCPKGLAIVMGVVPALLMLYFGLNGF